MPKTMDEIEALAVKLGQAIAETDQFQALVTINKKVRDDAALRALHSKYMAQEEKIGKLLTDKKPVEPEEKRELERLQTDLRNHDTMQELARVEADYSHLMSRVSRGINTHLDELLSGGEEKE